MLPLLTLLNTACIIKLGTKLNTYIEMAKYTDEKSIQVILSLLKEHGIKKIIASPGSTNHTIVSSAQTDPYFEMYSSVDERSAAYMACGLAAETGEPVVITCTEATAARNYAPGLTEAYYRKLPVLAITTTHCANKVGHLHPQIIDHTSLPNDVAMFSTYVPVSNTTNEIANAVVRINEAILELNHRGGGPAIINVETLASKEYSCDTLPKYRKIERHTLEGTMPTLPKGNIGIFIGSHLTFSDSETEAIDKFCEVNNAVVFCDQTSGYYGNYRVDFSLVCSQQKYMSDNVKFNLIIHIGEVSGDYFGMQVGYSAKEVWRVSPDGKLRDTFGRLRHIFEMSERAFFSLYTNETSKVDNHCLIDFKNERAKIMGKIPELPFSKVWAISKLTPLLPNGSTIHFSILGSLRAGNFFVLPQNVKSSCNVGGFGIDGATSTLLGASQANKEKLYFLMTGDLAFFYDLNAIGNRHLGNNVRILIVNNGDGTEFRMHWHPCSAFTKEECDMFMSAGGHFGNKSTKFVRHMAEDLGFEYLSADNKQKFFECIKRFTVPEITDRPMICEIFTDSEIDAEVVETMRTLIQDTGYTSRKLKQKVKNAVSTVLGEKTLDNIKQMIK